jgi:DNA mismatch endonuclease (patch repair protein)
MRARIAVFVDGCFWHGCPRHGTTPHTNSAYWSAKIARNLERDRATDQLLRDHNWTVLRVWEHDDPEAASAEIERMVR